MFSQYTAVCGYRAAHVSVKKVFALIIQYSSLKYRYTYSKIDCVADGLLTILKIHY